MDNDSPPKSELRQEYRRRLQVPLIVLDEQNQRIDGRTADISASGLGCMLSAQLHPGTVLMLSFSLPSQRGGKVVHARARVMNSTLHSDGFRTGLLWTDIAEETRQKIRAFAKPAPFLRI
ncbi:MAG: PilZ domain-containing protein [Rubrivivax sp.]